MKIIVRTSDMKVGNCLEETFVTDPIGSSIGIAIYEPNAGVGGILHFMLPDSSLNGTKATGNPFIFADTGIPAFLEAAYQLGARKTDLRVTVAGGAHILGPGGLPHIGERNHIALSRILEEHDLKIDCEDVGGCFYRSLKLEMKNGHTRIKIPGHGEKDLI
jgi:chemotaxis protein CheD